MNSDQPLAKTPLYALHQELGAKLVPFAGYSMPVQYEGMGIIKEHLHTRSQAGLFDVSHMGQLLVRGSGAAAALEALVPVDLNALAIGRQQYGVFTNGQGGILDDLIITRWADDAFFLVVNAACVAQDTAHLQRHLPAEVTLTSLTSKALMALQGPAAVEVLGALAPAVTQLTFMSGCATDIAGTEVYVTRSGYTGEDGFEISLEAQDADKIARLLLAQDSVKAIGLGARDSLRLEAGLCLYGHDMDTQTSPVEAGLSWSIAKSRRVGGTREGGFLGAAVILAQLQQGVAQRRVGLKVSGRIPVREGATLVDAQGTTVGRVTSGGFAPSLNAPVAMGYVNSELAQLGTSLNALVREKPVPVEVVALPFVKQNYYRG